MTVTITQFRKDVYRLFDRTLKSGEPLKVTCKGGILLLVPPKPKPFAERLKKRAVLCCAPEEIIHMDWSKQWKPFI